LCSLLGKVCSILRLKASTLNSVCKLWARIQFLYTFCNLWMKINVCCVRLNKSGLFSNKHNGMASIRTAISESCCYNYLGYQMTEYLWKNAMSLWTTSVKNDYLLHQVWDYWLLLLIYITHTKCYVKNIENLYISLYSKSTNSQNSELYRVTVSVVEKTINNFGHTWYLPYIFLIYYVR
jgi:hypothetical protein